MSIRLSQISQTSKSMSFQLSSSTPFLNRNQRTLNRIVALSPSSLTTIKPLRSSRLLFANNSGFPLLSRKNGFIAKAENGGGENENEESSMAERWFWFAALAFLVSAWRDVLWKLSNWKKAASDVSQFFCYIRKLDWPSYMGDQIKGATGVIESTIRDVGFFCTDMVASLPVEEVTKVIIFASCVLAIAEAAVPDSVNSQSFLLTAAGIIGFAAVRGYISNLLFWCLLPCLFLFARLIRKRDYVSDALPVAAVLAAVGVPLVRTVVVVSYTALAVLQHSKMPPNENEGDTRRAVMKAPFPLLCAALGLGFCVAALWVIYGYGSWDEAKYGPLMLAWRFIRMSVIDEMMFYHLATFAVLGFLSFLSCFAGSFPTTS